MAPDPAGRAMRFNLALRGAMEFGVVIGFGYWGYTAGHDAATRTVYAVGAPAIGFGVWGLVDFRAAGRLAEPLRLLEELLLSGLAAAALYAAGKPRWGIALATLSVVHHALVYALGDRLIRP